MRHVALRCLSGIPPLQGKIPNPEIQQILKLCEHVGHCIGFTPDYNAIFVCCPNSLEGGEINP